MKSENKDKVITIPNILSFFRICLIPIIVWLYIVEEKPKEAGFVLILSGITDITDGFIARTFNMTSDLGKVLDPIADKLTQATMLICLLVRFPLMIITFLVLIVKEIYMGLSGLLIIKKTGIVLGAQWHGKAATALLYSMMIIHLFWPDITITISNILIFACTVMIIVSFILYAIRNTKALKQNMGFDKELHR